MSLILARSCELQIVANRMIISLYVPYLRAHSVNPLHQASLAIMNAAHKIIRCMKIWQSRWNSPGIRERGSWGSFGVYYEYGRILFDAAVVCASIAIDETGGAFAACLKEDIDSSLEVLKDMEVSKEHKCRGAVGSPNDVKANVSEPIAIVEMLKQKVEANKVAGIKRKRQHGETDAFQPGFRIPFVGAAVSAYVPNPTPLVPPEFTSDISPVPPRDQSESASKVKVEDKSDDPISGKKRQRQKPVKDEQDTSMDKRKPLAKARPKDKETKYPSYGIRVRPGLPPPYIRGRGAASRTPKPIMTPTDGPKGQPNTPLTETPSTLPSTSSAPSPILVPQHLETRLYDEPFPPTPVQEQPMADDDRRRSVTASFDAGPDAHMQPRGRYGNTGYPQNPTFFDHPSFSGGQATSPTSAGPTPPFHTSTLAQPGPGQFSGAPPHQDYFPQSFRDPPVGSNGFDSMPYNGVGPSLPSYQINSMEQGPPPAVTSAPYMVPDEKSSLNVFMPNEPQMLPGSSQTSPHDMHMASRQDWQPPPQNSGDQQYWF